ncbi:MAG: CDP-alcohol phosphatidyltransferase family protein [Hyphomicrobiales bacterium]|nr:CDP-alcohol phosphatidyltransferase family protein [Hyphomicrobiales bacterium]
MLDGWARRHIDPLVRPAAAGAAQAGLSANAITVSACIVGLASAAAIANGWFTTGLLLILASRFGDALDGAVARLCGKTDLGGYLDIVLDFVFYGAVPMGFVLADPTANAMAGAALILSFYVNGSSFLAYAVVAERRKLETDARGSKSLYFTTGLAEATETIAAFALACVFPGWFPVIAWMFAAMALYTALARIILAARTFR